MDALLHHIRDERGFDFTGYKRASLARRIQRRMDAVGSEDHVDYLDRLMLRPDEFTALFNTILINVTSFYRDPEAWRLLQDDLLPAMLQRRAGKPIRVWSAGCASGQEAATVAMLLAETLGLEDFRHRVKIYATDVDEEALAQARQATYSPAEVESVPAQLRERWFDASDDRFVLRKELRRAIIYGRNDLVQDAPISHIDLLLCRNTLMYFNAETQAQVLSRLHFALGADALLFLGKAEMLLSHAALFRPVELKQRFFQKIPTEPRERRPPPAAAAPETAIDEAHDGPRLRHSAFMSSASAQIVVDTNGRLVLANHRATHLFGLAARDLGRAIQDLELSYRPVELRTHLDEAIATRRSVWLRDVELVRGADRMVLDIQVLPLADDGGSQLGTTVIFSDVTESRQLQQELLHTNRQLETAYEELQSTNEELETTNEELQSTVEELETTNEELQSTNEELETMNEELQSMNDELHFANSTLRERQDEVDRLNRFTAAILGSLDVGVAVVDAELSVLAWSSGAEELWGVRADEVVGKHLLNLDIGLPVEQLRQPIRSQLDQTQPETRGFELDAVNRRGRSVRVHVRVTTIADHGGPVPAAVITMGLRGA